MKSLESYDRNGRRIRKDGTEYYYDGGRLIFEDSGTDFRMYLYDSLGPCAMLRGPLPVPQRHERVVRQGRLQEGPLGEARQGQGRPYLSSCPPYGYLKDPSDKHRLVVDPDAAPTVRRMFAMADSGMTCFQIASRLKSEGVLRPL